MIHRITEFLGYAGGRAAYQLACGPKIRAAEGKVFAVGRGVDAADGKKGECPVCYPGVEATPEPAEDWQVEAARGTAFEGDGRTVRETNDSGLGDAVERGYNDADHGIGPAVNVDSLDGLA